MNQLHPFSAVTYAVQYGLLCLWIPVVLVLGLAGVSDLGDIAWVPFAAPIGFLVGAAYGVGYYFRFAYEITPETFDVAAGILARRVREIPYRRIQNVDVRQSVLQRLLGLAVVSVETAGGGSSEATLHVVSKVEADRICRRIRRRTAAANGRSNATNTPPESTTDPGGAGKRPPFEPTSGERPPQKPTRQRRSRRQRLFVLESTELLLYSLTTLRPAAVAAVFFVFFLATDVALEVLVTVARPFGGPQELGTGDAGSYGVLTVVSLVNGVVVTYLLSVAYTLATYYDFRLGRVDDDFVYERGLLQRYSGSIPAEKVQSMTITDNPVQRLLGYAGLWVETAGYGPDKGSDSQSAVPLAEAPRVHQFTEALAGVETPKFERPPLLARRRYLVRYAIVAAGIVGVVFWIAQVTSLERWYLATVAFAPVPPAAHLRYVNLGYYVGDDHLVIRRGFWRRRTTVIPYYRIQTVSTRRSIFQRRLGLASLAVDTASSRTFDWKTPTIYDVALEDARAVHETGRTRLQLALRERDRVDGAGFSVDFT